MSKIQIRKGASNDWISSNPTLAQGEMGLETDTKKIKIGDGTTAWNSLQYVAFDGGCLDCGTTSCIGDIAVHTDGLNDGAYSTNGVANVLFTAPSSGTVTIDGSIYITPWQYIFDGRNASRSNHFELYANGSLISTGSVITYLTNPKSNPYKISQGTGGSQPLTRSINSGGQIEFRILSDSTFGQMVGVDLNISYNGGNKYSLKNDWNDSNPNGPWTYREGNNAITNLFSNWIPANNWTVPQPAFAPGNNQGGVHVPSWMKLKNECPATQLGTTMPP